MIRGAQVPIQEPAASISPDKVATGAEQTPVSDIPPGAETLLSYHDGTLLYSPLPCTVTLSYEEIGQMAEQEWGARETYPPLPWAMEALIGTTWCNIYSGESHTVHHIGVNRFNRPVLCAIPSAVKQPGGEQLECIGFWLGGRYLVEQWVRVDHQDTETQLAWFGIELGWLRRRIERCARKLVEYQGDATNRAIRQREKKANEARLQLAEVHVRDFAARHSQPVPLAVLNSGVGSGQFPAQMALL